MTDSDLPEKKSPEDPPRSEEDNPDLERAGDASTEAGEEDTNAAEKGWSLDEVTLGALEGALSPELGGGEASAGGVSAAESGTVSSPEELDALIASLRSGEAGETTHAAPEPPTVDVLSNEPLVTQRPDDVLERSADAAPELPADEGGPDVFAQTLSVEELDALLVAKEDAPLDGRDLDAVLGNGPTQAVDAGALGQSEIDSLISSLGDEDETVAKGVDPPSRAPAPEANLVSQDLLDQIVSSVDATGEETGDDISDADIEAIIRQAQHAEAAPAPAASAGAVPVYAPSAEEEVGTDSPVEGGEPASPGVLRFRRRRGLLPKWIASRLPSPGSSGAHWVTFFHDHYARVSAVTATMVVFTLGTFTFLYTHQNRVPTDSDLARLRGGGLARAMEVARNLIAEGAYADAAAALEGPIAAAPPGAERTDARYLRTEALVEALPASFSEAEGERVHAEIDDLLEYAPSHPRAPEALRWKAELYARASLPRAARETYTRLLNEYPNASELDDVLMDLARICVQIDQRKEAAAWVQHLLRQFPGSPRVGEARLWLADAFAGTGNRTDAHVLYVRVAEAYSGTKLGADAIARLGELAYDEGDYREAVNQLEAYLRVATTVEGHDRVYLVLAKAYRALAQLDEAHRVLNELIRFFPENETTPAALIELSQLLDEMGHRKEALRTASRAARTYRDNPLVLENAGDLYGLAGETAQAARYWMDAHLAGSTKPEVLLSSARAFRAIGNAEEAMEACRLLQAAFAGTAEALEAGIEHAQILCEAGRVREALERLELLAAATEGRPQQLPVLTATGDLYQSVGLSERAADAFRDVAALSTEPEVLAHAAASLLESGAIDDGLVVAKRVDVRRLSDETAHRLLMGQGAALTRIDPREALDKMQQAYDGYPAQRTPESEQQLLEAYLALDNTARARALVMDIEARVRQQPVDGPRLQRAALAWGDYLYARSDYRAAADAFDLALEWGASDSPDLWWMKFQRANALFRLSDIEGSVALFDEVAAAATPWAEQAALMADYARLEQRLRGLPVTAQPKSAG